MESVYIVVTGIGDNRLDHKAYIDLLYS